MVHASQREWRSNGFIIDDIVQIMYFCGGVCAFHIMMRVLLESCEMSQSKI